MGKVGFLQSHFGEKKNYLPRWKEYCRGVFKAICVYIPEFKWLSAPASCNREYEIF